jgi:hypothetical protein
MGIVEELGIKKSRWGYFMTAPHAAMTLAMEAMAEIAATSRNFDSRMLLSASKTRRRSSKSDTRWVAALRVIGPSVGIPNAFALFSRASPCRSFDILTSMSVSTKG